MTDENRCEVCGKTFKTPQALAGHLQGLCGTGQPESAANTSRESKALAKTGSLEAAIEKLQVPTVPAEYNGNSQVYWEGFNRGVNYGATSILVGIRSAQELSSLGISQATPIIKMAQEMRQAEGQAAQELAAQLGQVSIQGNQQILAALNNLGRTLPGAPDPMAQVMAETMKPFLEQVMQGVLGGVLGGFQKPRSAPSQLTDIPGQTQPIPETFQGIPEQSTSSHSRSHDAFGVMPDNVTTISKEEAIDV